jgi:hypothetical protein
MKATLRNVVIIVASLNLAYFGVEFAVATAIGSVSLFADSIDFLEDTSVNFLIAIALGWSARKRGYLGMVLPEFYSYPDWLHYGPCGRNLWLHYRLLLCFCL